MTLPSRTKELETADKSPTAEELSEKLSHLSEISKNAQTTFFALLLGCSYAILTIGTTTDSFLVSNSSSAPLPILGAIVPMVWFFAIGPLVLSFVYLYFHLYLQRLWRGVAELPALDQTGRPIDDYVYPWLVTCTLVRAYVPKLRTTPRRFRHLELALSVVLGWWFVPLTLLLFWARYLTKHDWQITGVHVILLSLCVAAALLFYRLAAKVLQVNVDESAGILLKREHVVLPMCMFLFTLTSLFVISFGAIEGAPALHCSRAPRSEECSFMYSSAHFLQRLGFSPFANVEQLNLSKRPATWSGNDRPTAAELLGVEGAVLARADLRHIRAIRAFLAQADMRGADLRWADLRRAQLQAVKLAGAKLNNAKLEEASLYKADLTDAALNSADLSFAQLENADLTRAILNNSYLYEAKLQKATGPDAQLKNADMRFVNMQHARFGGADFTGAQLLRADLRHSYFNSGIFKNAVLVGAFLQDTTFSAADFENANLREAQLTRTDLHKANLKKSDLSNAKLFDATLEEANVNSAILSAAVLDNADFRFANLQDAKFIDASLRNTNFSQANMAQADLTDAVVNGAIFVGANLRGAQLHKVKELTPQQLSEACGDENTTLPPGWSIKPCPNTTNR